ncbi:F0F1 ATP synthase subunit delta [Ancrocorticia populi]|uniref:ATP synthase subunit delta n=1 Tax=Ancrocorticia populi TaxID=2175228 RepID=A0A2V1JZQ8_9ACTO|nr:F0F1 ATP synthase subunit delta [Ancrocorticia populi]PWF24371.1 F0F1 ATP synthase subunit delta [Ancrocorticia populi]
MRSSTEAAFSRLADVWDTILAERDGGEHECARELFRAARLVEGTPTLGKALTDPARASADRSRLVLDVFGDSVSGPVSDLLSGIARERWGSPAELVDVINRLGVQSVLSGAGRAGILKQVEEELYHARRLLRDERDLRVALGDRSRTADERAALTRSIFTGMGGDAQLLLVHAVRMAPERAITQTLAAMTQAAAERSHRLLASVTVAVPLTRAQEERLTRLLSERYQGPVNVHVYVDTRVVGGMRIRVGDEVMDGTLAHRVAKLREEIK